MKKIVVVVLVMIALLLSFPGARMSYAAEDACSLENSLIVGSQIYGISCLDETGWHTYIDSDASLPFTSAQDIALCPDNNLAVLHILGLAIFDGTNWKEHTPGSWFSANTIACGEDGQLWVGHFEGVSHFDGSTWVDYPLDQFGTSDQIFSVDDISVGADGSVWAVTGGSAAKYDNGQWQVFENESGLEGDLWLSDVAVDNAGQPWVIASGGLLHYDGSTWHTFDQFSVLQSIAVGGDNQVWVGTFGDGALLFDGTTWQSYTHENSGIASGSINAITIDQQGRVWVGASWGLSVFDGETWTTYLMENSGLVDNLIGSLVVTGDGPPLPEVQEHQPGSVVGIIEMGASALPGTQIELCAGIIPSIFFGPTPCSDVPGSLLTTTDNDGSFIFNDVPIGRYQLSIETPDGWIYFIGSNTEVEVLEGQQVDLADIEVSE